MLADDMELLSRYARQGAEDAFETLVRRHSGLVYATALRHVHSPDVAEEVAQSVFIELSRNAARIGSGVVLSGWLYRVTRSRAVDAMRKESRRLRREQQFAATRDPIGPQAFADSMESLLDDALDTLPERDRTAIILRFFERKSMSDIGDALGISADAAQKRVSRAMDSLRGIFAKRGLSVGTAAVTAGFSANATHATPVGLPAGIFAAVKSAGSAIAAGGSLTFQTIIMTTTQKSLVAALVALAAGLSIYQIYRSPEAPHADGSGPAGVPIVSDPEASSTKGRLTHQVLAPGGPRALLQPRLTDEGKRRLQNASDVMTGDAEAWSREDDNLLVAWAAQDPEAALNWVNTDGDRQVNRAQTLGAVAAGILLKDGREAMQRFLDAHQQDPELRPKDQGDLEKHLFFHLGREDTFNTAMEILAESKNPRLAGSLVSGIDGAQFQTSAIDYMEAKGIQVQIDYWSHQDAIGKDPRYWADWAWKRDSGMLPDIVNGWARDNLEEARAWVEDRIPKDDKNRAAIDELLKIRDGSGPTESDLSK